jgi:hypothetical protein
MSHEETIVPGEAVPEPPPASRSWMDLSLPLDTRAALLLAQMTLEETIDLATGEPCGL